jgi:putative transposase
VPGLIGSMGRVGACGDNAAMKYFLALLQKNLLDRQRWTTREELRLAIITWIERIYHRRRRRRRLGRLTPVEYETTHPRRSSGLVTPPDESTGVGAVPNVTTWACALLPRASQGHDEGRWRATFPRPRGTRERWTP